MPAAVNQENQNTNNSGGTSIGTALSNTQAGASIVVWVHNASAQTVSGVADTQGNTYVQQDTVTEPTNLQRLTSFVATNIVGGASANTITATFSASSTRLGICAGECRTVTSSPIDGHIGQNQGGGGPGTGTDALTTGSGAASTNANQPALIYGCATTGAGAGTISAGTGFTLGQQFAPWIATANVSMATESKRITATGAQAATFTQDSAFRTLALMVILDESAAPTPTQIGMVAIVTKYRES